MGGRLVKRWWDGDMWRDAPESYNSTSGLLSVVSAALSVSADNVLQVSPSPSSSTSMMAAQDSSSDDSSVAAFALSLVRLSLALSSLSSRFADFFGPSPSFPPPFAQHSLLQCPFLWPLNHSIFLLLFFRLFSAVNPSPWTLTSPSRMRA